MKDKKIAQHWLKQIERLLTKDVRFYFNEWPKGKEILEGIKENVEENQRITKKQIRTIKNIQYNKN